MHFMPGLHLPRQNDAETGYAYTRGQSLGTPPSDTTMFIERDADHFQTTLPVLGDSASHI